MVDPPDAIAIGMRERAFDRVGMPETGFVEQRRGHRPKAMRSRIFLAVPEPPQACMGAPLAARRGFLRGRACFGGHGNEVGSRGPQNGPQNDPDGGGFGWTDLDARSLILRSFPPFFEPGCKVGHNLSTNIQNEKKIVGMTP